MANDPTVQQRLSDLVTEHKVLLFMKGSRHFPQCGFSATVTQILDGLIPEYRTVNVLTDPEIRQGIKEFSNWPTIPQLYVDGQFVGGCDIIREMYLAGELQSLLGVAEQVDAPAIRITAAAAEAFRSAADGESSPLLRLEVDPHFDYALSVDEPRAGDFQVDAGQGVTVLIDRESAKRADGLGIDYATAGGGGFKIDNPNEPPRVKELSPTELATMRQTLQRAEAPLTLVDVRTEQERATATIEGSLFFDEAGRDALDALDREAPVVFFCHHGHRSRAAAEAYLREGFKNVYNLDGGIDAWSQQVDSSVPRY